MYMSIINSSTCIYIYIVVYVGISKGNLYRLPKAPVPFVPTFPPQTSAMERKEGFQRCLQFHFCRLLN